MSTDLQQRRTPAPEPPPEEPKPKSGLSVSQVLGGALAAMTAAALGSRLSVAGTVVGAALASVIAAVAGSLYTSSLRHTRDRVSRVWTGKVRGATPAAVDAVAGGRTDAATAPPRATAVQPLPADVEPGSTGTAPGWQLPERPAPPKSRRSRVSWKTVLAASVATFALAFLALTGFELVTGQALSGGQGTTIGEVSEGRATAPEPTSTPTAGPSTTPSASASTSAEPTAAPTAPTTPTASAQPTPSATASDPATPTPSSTPSASAPASAVPSAGG